MTPAIAGANSLTTSRTAEGKTLTPRTISMSSVRPMQRTRGAVRPQAQRPTPSRTWSRVRKRSSGAERLTRWVSTSSPSAPSTIGFARAARRIDQLEMNEAAAAEMHARLVLALAPQRNRNVADAHRFGDARAPRRLELGAHRRFAAARFARDHQPPHARAGEIDAARARPFGQMQRIGRASSRRRSASGARPPPSAARCCRCRPGCGRGRAGRRRRAPRRRRTGRRCRSRRCARRASRRTPRRSAPRCAPRRRDRRRSAECSSAFRSCRWSNRCGRSRRASPCRCVPIGSSARARGAQFVLFGERQRRRSRRGRRRRRGVANPARSSLSR